MEHAGDVGLTMIERQKVQRPVVAEAHDGDACAKSLVTSAWASAWIRSRCGRSRKLSAYNLYTCSVPDGRTANHPSSATTFSPPMDSPLPGAVVRIARMASPASSFASDRKS